MSLITYEQGKLQTNNTPFNWPFVFTLFFVLAIPALPATLIVFSVIFSSTPSDSPFAFVNELYFSTPSAVIVHGASGIVFFLTLPLQFSPAIREKHSKLHRTLGYFVFTSGISMGLSGSWMHLVLSPEDLGARFVTLILMSLAMCYSFVMALLRILQTNVQAHERWVRRAVAITLGAITSILVEVVFGVTIGQIEYFALFLGDFNEQYARFVAVCLNLTIVELFFNRKLRL